MTIFYFFPRTLRTVIERSWATVKRSSCLFYFYLFFLLPQARLDATQIPFPFQVLVLFNFFEYHIFLNFSIEFASYCPPFQNDNSSSRQKIVDSENVEKLKILYALNVRCNGILCWIQPIHVFFAKFFDEFHFFHYSKSLVLYDGHPWCLCFDKCSLPRLFRGLWLFTAHSKTR